MMYLTGKEEELVNLLFKIGIKRNVATVLVFLAKTPMVSSRAIVRGTDLRQPEVVIVIRYLKKRGWIKNQDNTAKSKGRPVKIYELAKPITEIMNGIEKEKVQEANDQLQIIQRLRNYIN
jgi:predicted transcriptional regulator